jgi:Cu/Ag efflux protein CusF
MHNVTMLGAAAIVLVTIDPAAAAQSKTIPGRTEVVTATVEAIDYGNREVTAKKADGKYEQFYFPPSFKRFDALKIGDKITAKYYENIVLRLKPAGEKDVDTASGGVVPAVGTAGTVSRQRTITATITDIDPTAPSITFSGPNGWKYSTRVEDKAALAKVKVGDKVDITWTEATILSLDEGK